MITAQPILVTEIELTSLKRCCCCFEQPYIKCAICRHKCMYKSESRHFYLSRSCDCNEWCLKTAPAVPTLIPTTNLPLARQSTRADIKNATSSSLCACIKGINMFSVFVPVSSQGGGGKMHKIGQRAHLGLLRSRWSRQVA